ncbi:hypothetical protein CHS0354_033997 [Potamilus streckersoni]|uniref:Nucleolar protein 4 n=1 Tax=Potamilus streckersoni TaxID=2493646 RepID=A0AAE0RMR0_9BIVA|nr:hypothetical protein CHS0354_033997 [Potamilus streckersoni]
MDSLRFLDYSYMGEYSKHIAIAQIAETYSFLPREAVTRFLMSCADCQKRMHIACDNNVIQSDKSDTDHSSIVSSYNDDVNSAVTSTEDDSHIDFRVPITQTYLNHMRNKGYFSAGFQDNEGR